MAEKVYKMTESEIQALVEKTVEGVYNRLAESVNEEEETSVWEMDDEDREKYEKEKGLCLVEDVNGEGGVCISRAYEGNGKDNKVAGIGINVETCDDDMEYEESDTIVVLDKNDIIKMRNYLNEVIVDMNLNE